MATANGTSELDPFDFSGLLRRRERHGERLINRVRGVIAILSIVGQIAATESNTAAARYVFTGLAVAWLIYAVVVWALLRRDDGRPRPWLKHLSGVVDAAVIGGAYFGTLVNHGGVMEYWTGGPLQVFVLWNLLPALRLAPSACWTSGVVTLLLNAALLAHTALTHAAPISTVSAWGGTSLHPPDVALTIIITSLPAFAAGWVAHMARDLLTTGARASAEKQRIAMEQERVRKFLPQDVMELVTKPDGGAALDGENLEISVVFVDIRGFTRFSDGQPPARTVGVLNAFFEEMVGVVTDCGGTLDKFLGDGFLAVFGAPHPIDEAPARAVLAAVRMVRAMEQFVATLPPELPSIDIGVAVATGEALVGTIGTQERMEFTCIGPAVNRAARLEGLNKRYQTKLLIDGCTRDRVLDTFTTERVDEVQLRGIVNTEQISTVPPRCWQGEAVTRAHNRLSRSAAVERAALNASHG